MKKEIGNFMENAENMPQMPRTYPKTPEPDPTPPLSMPSTNWIHPHDPACPPAVSKIGLPILRLASAINDEMPDCLEKWQAAVAIGTNNCAGRTLADIAAKAKVTELELLKGATKFCQRHNVHPSPYLQKFAAAHAEAKKKNTGAPPGEGHDKITEGAI